MVEIARENTPFAFAPSRDEGLGEVHLFHKLVQLRAEDVIWYKEHALQIALTHVPEDCKYVAWLDNDVVFHHSRNLQIHAPPDSAGHTDADQNIGEDAELQPGWWIDAIDTTFCQSPSVSLIQPFSEVALTTENIRNRLVGNDQRAFDETERPVAADDTPLLSTQPTGSDPTDNTPLVCNGSEENEENEENTEQHTEKSQERIEEKCPETDPTCTLENTGAPSYVPAKENCTTESCPLMSYGEALAKCRKMNRVKKGVLANPAHGASGTAWVARRDLICRVGFFQHAYCGGGSDLFLNVALGGCDDARLPIVNNSMQKYYFNQHGPFHFHLEKYRKKFRQEIKHFPAQCCYLPISMVHLFHGDLGNRTTAVNRHLLLKKRAFSISRNVSYKRSDGEEGHALPHWMGTLTSSNINKDMLKSLERNQSVRDKVLLRMAKTQRCLNGMKMLSSQVKVQHSKDASTTEQSMTSLMSAMSRCVNDLKQQQTDLYTTSV